MAQVGAMTGIARREWLISVQHWPRSTPQVYEPGQQLVVRPASFRVAFSLDQ
jgi:hypothetical protein